MAARKKKRPLRPRTPSRVKKRTTRKKRARAAHEHPELIGLGLVAVGLFLASLLYLGWEGDIAGEKIEAGLRDVIGSAAYVAPLALVAVGGLMLFRSALLDVKPFRTGLVVTTIGLMVTLGEHGGAVGNVLGGGIAKLLGGTGSASLGLTALLAGGLLLSGASYGAVLRRSHHAVRRAVARPERAPKPSETIGAAAGARAARAADRRGARLSRRRLGGAVRAAAAARPARGRDRGAGGDSSTCRAPRGSTCCRTAPS